jgi:hypothetical protein
MIGPLPMNRAGGPSERSSQELDILLADYQTCREDERLMISIQGAVFGVFVTLIGLMAAAITQTCEFRSSANCVKVPDYMLAATPLIPIALLAYTTMIGVAATFRSYYMRGLEEAIRKHTSTPILGELRAASFTGMTIEVISLRRGRISYRLLANLVLAVLIIVFGGFTAYVGFHVGHAEQIAMTVIYGSIAALLVWEVSLGTLRGRTFFLNAAEQFLRHQGDTNLPQPGRRRQRVAVAADERSLASYLIFPRPEDWIKLLIAPGVFLATAWSTASLGRWRVFLAIWLILEYLIYGARYQWNDVRGVAEDQSHSQRRARARLPVGPGSRHIRRNVLVSIGVGALKLIVAILLAVGLGLAGPVLLLMALVFAIAIVYEALRSVQSPSTPGKLHLLPVAVWCAVGLGYGVRAGLGFLAGGFPAASGGTVVGIACFVAFGIMFVLMTWVLEATSSCVIDSGETWRLKPYTEIKPHLLLLLNYVSKTKVIFESGDPYGTLPRVSHDTHPPAPGWIEHILDEERELRTPWNLALVAGVVLGGILGQELAHTSPLYLPSALAMSISVLGGILIMKGTAQGRRLAIAVAGTVALDVITIPFSVFPLVLVAGVPWLAITLVYCIFRSSSYQDLKNFGPDVLRAVASVKVLLRPGLLLLRAIIGGKTWKVFMSMSPSADRAIADGVADSKQLPGQRS